MPKSSTTSETAPLTKDQLTPALETVRRLEKEAGDLAQTLPKELAFIGTPLHSAGDRLREAAGYLQDRIDAMPTPTPPAPAK